TSGQLQAWIERLQQAELISFDTETDALDAMRAPAAGTLDPALSAPGEYETVLTSGQLQAWIERLQQAELISFDTETDALDAMRA
ncbi:hypothetical protein C7E12_21300, partial [Stenotrophomonas maltophilia]